MKRKSKPTFVAKDRTSSEAVNFLALVSGMVTTLIIAMVLWIQVTKPQAIEQIFAGVNAHNQQGPPTTVGPKDFEAGLAEATSDELEVLLIRFNNWNRSASTPVKIEENKKRVKIANALMLHPLNRQQRKLAVISKINAQSAIFGMEFMESMTNPNHPPARGANLRATAEKHMRDSDGDISQAANLAILKVDAFEIANDFDDVDAEPLAKKANQMLTEYPDNEFVLSNVKLILKAMLKFRKKFGIDLIRDLIELSQDNQSSGVEELRQFLRDEVLLSDLNYSRKFEDIWVNGDSGQRELFRITVNLAKRPSGGEKVVSQVDAVANWFEQYNQYERAEQIYQALFDSADSRSFAKVAEMARQRGSHGLQRCALVGQPIEFNGILLDGEPLNQANLENKVVVVFFWSADQAASASAIKTFHARSGDLYDRQVRVLAVCIDQEPSELFAGFGKLIPRFPIVIGQRDGKIKNTLYDQCPVDKVPHAMLVNHLGKVADVNVPLDELKTSAEGLSASRFKTDND